MLKSFEAKNFRGFQDLTLRELDRVNLIAGRNNVGKTALLEALFIHSGSYHPELGLTVNAFRGIEEVRLELGKTAEFPWNSLFTGFDTTKSIELHGEDTTEGTRVIRINEMLPDQALVGTKKVKKTKGSRLNLEQVSARARILRLQYEDKSGSSSYDLVFDLDPSDPKRTPYITPTPPNPPFPAFFLASRIRIPFEIEAELFGRLEIQKGEQDILQFLQIIEPNLKSLRLIYSMGKPIFHGDMDSDRLLPLPMMGEGMVRLLSFILRIANAPDGVVLIDEIENGLHYSILPKLWSVIGKMAKKYNTQVFATTHSLECIKAAHQAFSNEDTYEFLVHRLQFSKNGDVHAVTYDREDLEAAFEIGIEVR
ncbi:DNA replication and repair protein RecF [ANME-1 cluster archaeon GoMg2]|nr:DNA replication and repair protein RecF [ANME-1 cluster archaeon GoMg2]